MKIAVHVVLAKYGYDWAKPEECNEDGLFGDALRLLDDAAPANYRIDWDTLHMRIDPDLGGLGRCLVAAALAHKVVEQ